MTRRGGFWALLSVRACCLFLLSFLIRARVAFSQNQTCESKDLNALLGFANELDLGWVLNGSSSGCCDWSGVTCGPPTINGRRVVGLDLSGKSLRGSISDSLAGLDQLKRLDLSVNSLQGVVPPQLLRLPLLEFINLSTNQLKGVIPSNLSLPAIQVFNISYNQFTGSHPILVGSNNLTSFDLTSNKFYGPIDAGICNSSAKIRILRFSENSFYGDLPRGLRNCSSLTELWLSMNDLSGDLPDALFDMTSMTQLFLEGNQFSGNLSTNMSNLSNLVEIDLSLNRFSGLIPDVFGSLAKLESFSAQSNKLVGNFPSSLSKLSSLRVLNLNNNSLSGEINLNCTAMPKLSTLNLGSNYFSGPIPDMLLHCVQLKTLNLAKNNLTGEIPHSFKNFTSLSDLSLSGNHFSNITSALQILQYCPKLTTLVLTRNFHGGEMMPVDGIQGFEKMELLVIANCALTGSIPSWLANLTRLKVLDISWNRLSGSIPTWLGNLDNLFYLDLSNNSFSGQLPNSLTQMKSLMSGSKSPQVGSTENFPFFIKRNSSGKGLQYNQVSSFPPSLILGDNMLVGRILPGFGKLVDLLVLDLSWNNLSGNIPAELSGMTSLEILDLSHNNLTGAIPSSLTNLSFLSKFDVAYNNLVGQVPTGGQFSTFSSSDFEGNSELCGIHLSPCKSQDLPPSRVKKHKRAARISIAVGIGIGASFLLGVVYWIILRQHSGKHENNAKAVTHADESSDAAGCTIVLLFHKDNKELNIDDILKSTNNFDPAFIVGCGGYGLVYKATLPDGRNIAIKRLSGDFFQVEREFQAEVETLSRAQHRNLVSLQGYCKFGNDRLLIYSYMENGSLDYWLHEKNEGSLMLDWGRRLQIALGAARGLAYLHESCEPHILHRDIKSSNILLDEEFEAHLADFGLARLISPSETHVTTDLVGTLGYIPPEYGQSPGATFKGDVYSFGVVLLELLTGRRPVDMCKPKGSRDVVSWVLQMKKERREAEVFDPCIYDKDDNSQILRMLELACLCGSDCEYRHSEGARINPRDCWYWLNGNCLNPKCSFRHPPLDSLFAKPMPTSGSVPPPQTAPLTRAPSAHSLSNNINKQSVPCHYFQWGQCLKGERCPYMHGPQASVALVSQQSAKASKLLPEPPQTSKKDRLQNATMQQNVTELNLDKPKTIVNMQIEMPSATTKLVTKAENAANAELSENKRLSFCPLDDEPPAAPQNVITTSSGHTLSNPWSHQIQATNEQPENGRDTDEFSREYSPGFDVLVEDDIKDPDYFHNEDDFRMASAHGGQNLEPEDDYDYHHSDYELITKTGRDRSNDRGKYDNYEQTCGRHGWEPKTSERFLDKPPSHGRVMLDREAKLDEMDGSDLRHRLLKQRRPNGSRSTDSRDGHGEHSRRNEDNVQEKDYGHHFRDRRQFPPKNSLSTRLQGRIAFPRRSLTDRASNLLLEKERGRGLQGRLSPVRRINSQVRHPERIRQQPTEEFGIDSRSIRNRPCRRGDANSLDFAGPKSLAELKGAKINDSSQEQSIISSSVNTKLIKAKPGKVEGLQESDNSPALEDPMQLRSILKRKREMTYADNEISTSQYDNNQGGGESAINESVSAAMLSLQSVHPGEAGREGNHTIGSHKVQDVGAVDGVITTEDGELTYDDIQSSTKADAVETEDGMGLENVEEEELENYCQRDGGFDYESGDFKANNDENAFQGDEEELDDEDDFARKVDQEEAEMEGWKVLLR
ncbi:Leucine rich repeat N-terminal domain, partial [Musa troglodytarum]